MQVCVCGYPGELVLYPGFMTTHRRFVSSFVSQLPKGHYYIVMHSEFYLVTSKDVGITLMKEREMLLTLLCTRELHCGLQKDFKSKKDTTRQFTDRHD